MVVTEPPTNNVRVLAASVGGRACSRAQVVRRPSLTQRRLTAEKFLAVTALAQPGGLAVDLTDLFDR
jgi:hypothetical protein